MKIIAIVPSAGKGSRIKSKVAKPYLKLGNKPILAYTLETLERSDYISGIIVAVSQGRKKEALKIAKKYNIKKLKRVVIGGATRFKSVFNCLKYVDSDTDYVLIHDGARPFLTEDIIRRVILEAKKVGAALAAMPTTSTIKKVGKNLDVLSTPPRKELWEAQTPQAFKKEVIVKAYNKNKKIKATDDAMLVELLGKKVKMVKGSYRNIKITTREDLELAKLLIK